jgi:hypothetical protein
MKKIFSATLRVAVAFSILFAIGCSSDSNPLSSTSSTSIDNQLTSFINDNTSKTDDNAALFRDADPMGCDKSQFGEDGRRGKGSRGGEGHHGEGGHRGDGDHQPPLRTKFDSLRLILHCLTLTSEQDTAVRQILNSLHTQVDAILQATRAAQEPLRTDAKAKAQVVLDGVKAGTITRADAKVQLDAIRTALNDALKPGRDAAFAQIQPLQDAALSQIRPLLTAAQQAQWDAWVTTGVLPC